MGEKNSTDMRNAFKEGNLGKGMAMRKALQDDFIKANGIKLGFMSFIAKAAANALAKYPAVNASVDGDDIIYHGYADLSLAVYTDRGLATPVLSNTERLSFADVERGIDGDAKAARPGGRKREAQTGGDREGGGWGKSGGV